MATFRARGNRWNVQVRRKGHPALTRSFTNRRDAERWARFMEAQLERGEVVGTDAARLDQLTLAELVTRYRDTVSIRKKGGAIERIVLTAFLRDRICQKRLSQLSSADFAAYRDRRLASVCANTIRREFSTLHNLFEVARHEWQMPLLVNPVHRVAIGKPAPNRERRLRAGEEQSLLAAGVCSRNRLVHPIIALAVQTGLRRGELLGLRWQNVDLHRRFVMIPDSKNGMSRHVVLTRKAVRVLAALPRNTESVFPMSANAFRLAWERVRRRAGLEDLHFHDLRHEALSRFFEMGLTTPEVASISGHRDPRMLFRYSHPIRQRVLEVIDRSDP
jgi:integrase